jgi:hypothetical protein
MMNEFKVALFLLLSLVMAYDQAKADGKIDMNDAGLLVGPMLQLPTVIAAVPQVVPEWKSASQDSRAALMKEVAEKFDIANDKVEGKIEAACDMIISMGALLA